MFWGNRRLVVAFASAAFTSIVFLTSDRTLHGQSAAPSGGFMDSASSVGLRPRLSAAEMRAFLPDRGTFTFPAPYDTQGVRLTTASDCGGADCVMPVGYSYWSNINNHEGSDTMLVFLGLERRKGGGGPTLFSFDKRSGQTRNLGPLFSSDSPYSWSTGEGWYFSGTRPTILYLNDGPRMRRYDVQARTFETVFDVSQHFGSDKYIWQMHSSHDDRVHSATLRRSGTWEMLGCVAYREDTRKIVHYAKKGTFDECQIDKSGRWLVMKENVDGQEGEDNRVIDLETGREQVLLDRNGAAGHSDSGFGFLIAEDNFNSSPGAVRRWDLGGDLRGGQPAAANGQGMLVYQLASWSSGLGHVAYGNAQDGMSIDSQMACASNASRQNLPRVNEIVCFKLDGSLDTLVVAPNLTDLDASGGGSDDYLKLPKGNVDVTGEYFIWTANAGTNRLDAYMVRVPRDLLGTGGGSSGTPPSGDSAGPSVSITAPAANSRVSGTITVRADAADPSGVAGVTFSVDGHPLGSEVTSPPYARTWDTATRGAGQHTVRAVARDMAGNVTSTSITVIVEAAGPAATQAVQWTSPVNVTASGGTLKKTGGCDGCADAGAVSRQRIGSGDGFVSFTASETGTLRFVGLSSGDSGTGSGEIKFALRLQGGRAEVRESGAYRAEVPFASGDALKVAVEGGKVTYSKNGTVFFRSAARPTYPLLVDTSFYDRNATISNAVTTGR